MSTFGTKLFFGDKASFDLDLEKDKKKILLLHLDNDSTSKREVCNTVQATEETIEETLDTVI